MPGSSSGRVWLTAPPGSRPRCDADVVQQVAPLPVEHVTSVGGLACTAPARTVVDCLRHAAPIDALTLGDAALRARLVTAPELTDLAARCRWPRSLTATALVPLLDGWRESGLESRSAWVLHAHRLPRPEVQVRVLDERGAFVGRADVLWRERGVVGEADGLVKYAGDDAARDMARERARQARLEALGLLVVRWTAQQLHGDPPVLVGQLRAALSIGDGRRFRGRFA